MGVTAKVEPLQSLAFGSISGTYALIGTTANAISIFELQNLTNASVTFSLDGVNDNFILPAYSGAVYDVTGNKAGDDTGLYIAKGTKVYAKSGGSPSVGAVYVTAIYDSSN